MRRTWTLATALAAVVGTAAVWYSYSPVVVQRTLYARLYSGFRPKSAVFPRLAAAKRGPRARQGHGMKRVYATRVSVIRGR